MRFNILTEEKTMKRNRLQNRMLTTGILNMCAGILWGFNAYLRRTGSRIMLTLYVTLAMLFFALSVIYIIKALRD